MAQVGEVAQASGLAQGRAAVAPVKRVRHDTHSCRRRSPAACVRPLTRWKTSKATRFCSHHSFLTYLRVARGELVPLKGRGQALSRV